MSWLTVSAAGETTDSVNQKRSFLKKIWTYVTVGEDEATRPLSKFSVIGGPRYDNEIKLSLAIVGTSQFRLNGCDALSQPSNVVITASASVAGFFSLSADGNIFFPNDSKRIVVESKVEYSPTYFWGIGYENCNLDANETSMKKVGAEICGDMLFRVFPNLYVGPRAQWIYAHTRPLERPELLQGQSRSVSSQGLGFTIAYDTRDYVTAATSGVYLHYSQLFAPKFIGNDYPFYRTDFRACYYHTVWQGAVIAGEARAIFNFGTPSWASMALMGDNHSMRGYYRARYRDRHMLTAQVELRQKIYGPVGATVWGGVGNVFHDRDSFDRSWLPNYGIGLRWTFRPHVNIRFDYGFGKSGQSGFLFSINEAF